MSGIPRFVCQHVRALHNAMSGSPAVSSSARLLVRTFVLSMDTPFVKDVILAYTSPKPLKFRKLKLCWTLHSASKSSGVDRTIL